MAVGKISVRLAKPIPKQNKPVNKEIPSEVKQSAPVIPAPPVIPEPPVIPAPPVIPEVRDVNIQPLSGGVGADSIRVCVAAPTVAQAKDFVCGLYYNMLSFLESSGLSLYTRDRTTLSMLTETKQYLEYAVSKRIGTELKYNPQQWDSATYVLTVSKAANQKLSTDMHFKCISYSQLGSANGGEALFVLLNCSQTDASYEPLFASLSQRPVNWIISGFEKEKIYYCEEPDSPPPARLRENFKQRVSLTVKNADTVSFAQVYGGLTVERNEGGLPVYTTIAACRDYLPISCDIAFVGFMLDVKKRQSAGNTGALSLISGMIEETVFRKGAPAASWRETYMKPEVQDNEQ